MVGIAVQAGVKDKNLLFFWISRSNNATYNKPMNRQAQEWSIEHKDGACENLPEFLKTANMAAIITIVSYWKGGKTGRK